MPPRRSARKALQPSSTDMAPFATSPRSLEQSLAPSPPSKPPKATLLAVAMAMDEENLTPPSASDVEDDQVSKVMMNGAADRASIKRKRGSKMAVEEGGKVEIGEISSTKGRKRGRKSNAELAAAKEEAESEEELDFREDMAIPAKGKKNGQRITVESTAAAKNGEQERTKKKAVKKSRIAKDEPQYDDEGNEIVKRKRKPREYPKKVYEIPDVERKTTTFRGRCFIAWLSECSVLILYRTPWIRLFEYRVTCQQA